MPRLIDADKIIHTCDLEEKAVGPDWDYGALRTAIEIAPTIPTFGEWISVKERMPDDGTNILVANAKTGSQYVSHKDLIWFSPERLAFVPTSYFHEFEFTHWMPLPCSPKEADKDA